MFTLLVLLFAAQLSWSNESALSCADRLAPSFAEMRVEKEKAIAIQTEYFAQLGIPADALKDQGLLKWMKIDPGQHSEIVLFSLNNFFGDSLIFHFSMLDYFLKAYPGVKIKVISPKAGVLSRLNHPDVEAITIPVRFAEYPNRADRDQHIGLLRERLPGFIKQQIKPGAFVLYDLTTLDKAGMEIDRLGKNPELRPARKMHRVLHELGTTAVGMSNLSEGYIFLGLAALEVNAPIRKIRPELWALKNAERLQTGPGNVVGLGLRKAVDLGSKNVYESWLYNMTVLFGSQAYMRWDSRYFVNPNEDEGIVHAFIDEQGLDPAKPYVLLNLNTFGRDKVRELTPVYAQSLIAVMNHLLTHYPELNILTFFPEVQFGPEVQEDLLAFHAEHRNRVALVPSSMREVQPALIDGARWLISYDSGLAHLASFKPSRDVLTVSLAAGSSQLWRRPDQPFLKITEGSEDFARQMIEWIESREQKPK